MNTMYIDKRTIDHWNKLLQKTSIDFDELEIAEDSTLFRSTFCFDDGCWADLEVCSGQCNLWCQMVWYYKSGYEMSCSDACADELEGNWICTNDEKYNVIVEMVN